MNPQLAIYFNTVGVQNKKERQLKAGRQNEIVLNFFKDHCMQSWTAQQVWNELRKQDPVKFDLRDSVKRAISTLTKLGYLIKTGEKIVGDYGDPVSKWQYGGKPSERR